MLLILQSQQKLSEDQERYVIKLQGKVKEEELFAALKLFTNLRKSTRALARAKEDLENTFQRCPRIPAKSRLPEPRRIGVGYRDKGALRDPTKPGTIYPRMVWSDDIAPALLSPPEEPRWISADELSELRHNPIQELALLAVFGYNLLSPLLPSKNQKTDPS
jgi:hypothetical protein